MVCVGVAYLRLNLSSGREDCGEENKLVAINEITIVGLIFFSVSGISTGLAELNSELHQISSYHKSLTRLSMLVLP